MQTMKLGVSFSRLQFRLAFGSFVRFMAHGANIPSTIKLSVVIRTTYRDIGIQNMDDRIKL